MVAVISQLIPKQSYLNSWPFSTAITTVSAIALPLFAYSCSTNTKVALLGGEITVNTLAVSVSITAIAVALYTKCPSKPVFKERPIHGSLSKEEQEAQEKARRAKETYFNIITGQMDTTIPALQEAHAQFRDLELEYAKIYWGNRSVNRQFLESASFRDRFNELLLLKTVAFTSEIEYQKDNEEYKTLLNGGYNLLSLGEICRKKMLILTSNVEDKKRMVKYTEEKLEALLSSQII